jgi:glutamine synthetase
MESRTRSTPVMPPTRICTTCRPKKASLFLPLPQPEMALEALDADREFLTKGGVFTDDMIDGYIELKQNEELSV